MKTDYLSPNTLFSWLPSGSESKGVDRVDGQCIAIAMIYGDQTSYGWLVLSCDVLQWISGFFLHMHEEKLCESQLNAFSLPNACEHDAHPAHMFTITRPLMACHSFILVCSMSSLQHRHARVGQCSPKDQCPLSCKPCKDGIHWQPLKPLR